MKNSILGKARWLRDVALATSKNNGARVAREWLKFAAMFVILLTLSIGNVWGGYSSNFTNKNLAVGTGELTWSASPAFNSFESSGDARGAQSSKATSKISITSANITGTVTAISVVASMNIAGSMSVAIGGNSFGTTATIAKGDKNQTYSFSGSATVSNKAVVITVTRGNGTFWIKSVTITTSSGTTYTLKVSNGLGGYTTYSSKVKSDLTEATAMGGNDCAGGLAGYYSGWRVGSLETPAASPGTTYSHATAGAMPASGSTLYAVYANNSGKYLTNPLCEETKTLSSIAITTQPTTTKYLVGETFSSAGAVVTATYSDATTAAVSANWTPTTGLVSGSNTITATYTEGGVTKTATTTVTAYTVTIQKKDEDGTTIADAGVTASASGRSLTASVGSTHYVFHTWKYGTASGTSLSNATSATTGALTGTPSAAVTVIAEFYRPYTVTWSVNGSTSTISATTNVSYNSTVSMPTPSIPVDCTGSTFMGWTTSANASYSGDSAPSPLYNGTSPAITGDVTFYAVFADED